MDKIQHNLEKEIKLLNLFGYSLIGPDESNRWLIIDDNQKQVGFIQYKLYNAISKRGFPKSFGHHTYIDSPNIHCEFTRRKDDKNKKAQGIDYNYEFEIKKENQDSYHVEMHLDKYPSIYIWGKGILLMTFRIDYKGLSLNFKSETENYNTEETLIYKNIDDEYRNDKEYAYQLRYSKKKHEITDDNSKYLTTRQIYGTQKYYDKNLLTISESTWTGNKLRTEREKIVEGTIEEMAIKHQMGIDCFKHFRYLINQILPLKEEVISSLVNKDLINEVKLSIFFPEYSKEQSESLREKKLTKNQ